MRILFYFILVMAFWLVAAETHARPPQARQIFGKILEVDRENQTLVVQEPGRPNPIEVRWRSRTRFVEHSRFTTAAVLNEGAAVEVHYRAPLIGQPFATKVVFSGARTKRTDQMELGQ